MRKSQSPGQEPKRPAKNYAAWLLGQREWSAKELSSRLRDRGYSEQSVAEAMEFCVKHNFQSDTRFAESRTRMRSSTRGNRSIVQELREKGVSSEIISATLENAAPEMDRALAAADRFRGLTWDPKLNAKAWRFLTTRGFSSTVIQKVLKEMGSGAARNPFDGSDEAL